MGLVGYRFPLGAVVGSRLMNPPDKSVFHREIVEAAIRLGSEFGEEGLTMRGIASRLGMSVTGLYQHVESKASILRDIRIHGLRKLLATQSAAYVQSSPGEQVRELIRLYVEFAESEPWLYRVLFHEDEIDWSQVETRERDDILGPLNRARDVFAEGVEKGFFRADLDIDRAPLTLWASMHGLASLILNGRISETHPVFPVPSRRDFVDQFATGLLRSFSA